MQGDLITYKELRHFLLRRSTFDLINLLITGNQDDKTSEIIRQELAARRAEAKR